MATQPRTTRLTYEDLRAFPEDNLRRELIDGELVVTAAPSTRHQDVVVRLCIRLGLYAEERGGKLYVAPTDVFLADTNVVEPDVLFVRPENVSKVERPFVRGAPDLVVEVSSPSTRRLELVRKRELYERFGIPEYWFVDLEADRVEVYRLEEARHGPPALLSRADTLESPQAPGFSIPVADLLGPSED
ncbi:MAG: Uma2 family endonuclease [Actinomycetota bacterium]|nr:Uma2 family endonuclease [Actinomycetota bacterium]